MRKHWIRAAFAALLIAGLVGCGGSGSDSRGDGPSADAVADARAIVEQYKQAPRWDGPTSPVENLEQHRGRLVVCVASTFAVPFLKDMCDFGTAAAREAGFRTLSMDGKGDPSEFNRAIRQSVSQGAVGIMLVAVPDDIVMPALKEARRAGVSVVSTAQAGVEYQPPAEIGANVTVDYTKVGELQIDYAIANTDGPVNALAFWGSSFPSEAAQAAGQRKELRRLCPEGCKLEQESVLISSFPRTIPPVVQTTIRKEPELNWVLPTFDGLNLYVVPAVTQVGAKDRVRSSSHNAVKGNLDFIVKDNVQVMSVGENTEWWAWGGIDALLRLVAGQQVEPENIPLRIFDKEVLEEIGADKLGDTDALYGNVDFRGNYRGLWGIE